MNANIFCFCINASSFKQQMHSRSQSTHSYSVNRKETLYSPWHSSLSCYLLIFIQGGTWTIPTPMLRGILPRSPLRLSLYTQCHQLCLNMGCHYWFSEPPQPPRNFMLYHSHNLTKERLFVGEVVLLPQATVQICTYFPRRSMSMLRN